MTHQEAVSTLASERYLLEEMTELERHAFEDHVFDCADCAEDVRAGAYLREGAKAGFVGSAAAPTSSVLAFPNKPARPLSRFIPWAAAASLALVAGYQALLLNTGSGPRFEPQALAPVTLRPASRGADSIVAVERDKPVALAIEINQINNSGNTAQAAGELSYDLRTVDGPSLLSGRAPAPEAGAPLFLLVPGASLSAPGRYVLTVADATGQTIGEYRFAANIR